MERLPNSTELQDGVFDGSECVDCGKNVIYDTEKDCWFHIELHEECNPCFLEDQNNWK